MDKSSNDFDPEAFWQHIQSQANHLGFSGVALMDCQTDPLSHSRYAQWIEQGFAGDMDYLARHASLRFDGQALLPQAQKILLVRMPYLDAPADDWRTQSWQNLHNPNYANISLYARGRDYHKIVRQQLQKLANAIKTWLEGHHYATDFIYRIVCDSAPVMEVELGIHMQNSWRGKHTLLLNSQEGSMFFLGGILMNINLTFNSLPDSQDHCGHCQKCLDICPTQAIIAPYQLDARRCIAYLTIEHQGGIPVEFRHMIGNRIYGCDDCQLICPWNKFAKPAIHVDFKTRQSIDQPDLLSLFLWDETTFLKNTEGTSIRRIGYWRWQRNIIIALGNFLKINPLKMVEQALQTAYCQSSDPILREHIEWALAQNH